MVARLLFVVSFIACCITSQAQTSNRAVENWVNSISGNAIAKASKPGSYKTAPAGGALYFSEADGIQVPYIVWVPKKYDYTKPVRAVVFLHGAILARDSFQYKNPDIANEPVFSMADSFNVLIVFPFARTDFAWGRSEAAHRNILNIIKQVKETYNVDKGKVYIGGISMGGNATYWFVNNVPDLFAGFYAFSSLPQEQVVQFSHITLGRPLYTMNAKDDQVFSYKEVEHVYQKRGKDVPGWHFQSVDAGGHRFIYGPDGKQYIAGLLSELLSVNK